MARVLIDEDGDLFGGKPSVIVNPVNVVGVMGKGLALEFRRRFPDNYRYYEAACARKELEPGGILVYGRNQEPPYYIVNLATKAHWRDPSRIRYVERGMAELAAWLTPKVVQEQIDSIVIPALGCGLGGLRWGEVLPVIRNAIESLEGLKVTIIPPREPRAGSRPKPQP